MMCCRNETQWKFVLVVIALLCCQYVADIKVGVAADPFGSARRFHPLPGTIIAAHCTWEVKLDTVYNRIPQTITEIICRNPNGGCGGNNNYNCRQIRSKMLVGYKEGDRIVTMRNNTVSIGCSCVRRPGVLLTTFRPPIIEKRGASGNSVVLTERQMLSDDYMH